MSTSAETRSQGQVGEVVTEEASAGGSQEASGDNGRATDASGRRRGGVTGVLQIVGVVLAVALALFYSREDSVASEAAESVVPRLDPRSAAPVVRVFQPATVSTRVIVETTGSVEVRSYVALTPQIGGQVIEASPAMRAGGSFAAGEVLFRIDPQDYRLALTQAEAEAAAAAARLKLRQAEADAARENWALLHGDAPVPDLVAKVPQIDQSQAELASARARLARAELDLERTAFSLPFDGRVTETSIAVGQTLDRGQSFGEAFATDAVEVIVPVSPEDLARLEPVVGRQGFVRAGGREIPAVVDRAAARLDERTRFVKLYLTLEEGNALPPGTFVDVTLQGPEVASAYVLPEASEQVGSRVWLVSGGVLSGFDPEVLARTGEGLVVSAFDYGEGIVLGSVPGAQEGLSVITAGSSGAYGG